MSLFPTGNPSDGYIILPPIDVTGNQGNSPGSYTLDSVVSATNIAFRQPGFNYRFIAFEYQGEFGIMLADSYNNAGFAIMSAVMGPNGFFDPLATSIAFQNNAIGIFPPNLPGTFTVTNGSPVVVCTIALPASAAGNVITFTSQPNVNYFIPNSFFGGTGVVLTSNYTGTSNSSTTAQLPNNSTSPIH